MHQAVANVEGYASVAALDQRAASPGIWSRSRAGADAGAPVQLVPSEHVLVTTVTLQIRRPGQRLASLPFALEDKIAQPIEHAHFVLGPSLQENLYLAAVVDQTRMEEWLSTPRMDGRRDFRLVPDIFVLPVPPDGVWNIATLGDRVIVRLPDGTGLATQTDLLASFHAAGGSPRLLLCIEDGPLPALPVFRASEPADWTRLSTPFDLRQGRFAPQVPQVWGTLLELVKTAVAGLIAVSLLSAIDALVLGRQAALAEITLDAELDAKAPGANDGRPAALVVEELTARAPDADADPFLVLLAQTGEAWPAGAAIQLRELSFSAASGDMEFLVEAGTISELGTVAAGLESAGVEAELGASVTIPGGAEGRIRISAQGASR